MGVHVQSDIRSAIQFATAFRRHSRKLSLSRSLLFCQLPPPCRSLFVGRVGAFSTQTEKSGSSNDAAEKLPSKPPICTADELHYVTAKNSKWRLALWRYTPPPQVRPSLPALAIFIRTLKLMIFIDADY